MGRPEVAKPTGAMTCKACGARCIEWHPSQICDACRSFNLPRTNSDPLFEFVGGQWPKGQPKMEDQ